MNNNRGNNRRRGRGTNTGRPQNGGQNVNRIDSRARGNAPQLLEKYRKLAQDAHLNGDRVQAEYYLQFADHYFRVLADARVRQEEARKPRDERWQEGGDGQRDDGDDSNDFTVESDFPTFDTPPVYTRREREERGEGNGNGNGHYGGNGNSNGNGNGNGNSSGYQRRREEPAPREEIVEQPEAAAPAPVEDAANPYEPPENPFLRENRGTRGLRPRREDRRPRREEPVARESEQADGSGLEAALPPSISTPARKAPEPEASEVAAPAPKRRTRKKPVTDAGEKLETTD